MTMAHAHHQFDDEDEDRTHVSSTDQPSTSSEQAATVTEMHRLDKKITKEKAARKVSHAELKAQLGSLEATTAAGFTEVHAKFTEVHAEFTEVHAKMDAGFTEVHAKMDAGFTEVHAKMDAGFKELRGEVAEKMSDLVRTMVLAHVAIAIVMLAGMAGIVATIVNLAIG